MAESSIELEKLDVTRDDKEEWIDAYIGNNRN